MVRHKKRWEHNQPFKLHFFKMNLHFDTSNFISMYINLNLLTVNIIFLVFFSRDRQKTLMQTKGYYKLFYYVSNEASQHGDIISSWSQKPLKVAAGKKSFSCVFLIDKTCFDECLSFDVITAKSIFYRNLSLPRGLM